MIKINNQHKNEKGFASIVIALILIVVLALLTVGFAQLSRREQQNALDKQLANQASYAAETGINDIYQAITATPPTITAADPNTTTANGGGVQCLNINNQLPNGVSTIISQQYGISYTCALLNLVPQQLVANPTPDNPWDTIFGTTGVVGSLTINWSSQDPGQGHNTLRASGDISLPPVANWTSPALLQISIKPIAPGANAASLAVPNGFNAYLYPSPNCGGNVNCVSSPTAFTNVATSQGEIISGGCSAATKACSVTITGIPPGVPGELYLLRVVPYYDPATNLSTTAAPLGGGTNLGFTGSQAVIDVTGHAKNVLKRLRAVVSLNGVDGNPGNSLVLPNDALEAQDICKRFDTIPAPSTTTPNPPSGDNTGACNLN